MRRDLPNPGWGPLSALPGNPLMWVLILSEMLVFTAFFALYAGQRAVAFVDGNTIALRVFCREQGGALDQSIRYGLTVTIEAGAAIQVYEEVRQGLGIRPRA